jgi:hypothetical protein
VDTNFDAEPTGVEVDSDFVGQQDPSAESPTEPRVETQRSITQEGDGCMECQE